MGSTVLALPAIERLQQCYPGIELHYLCFDENRSVLDLFPRIRIEAHTLRSTSLMTLLWDSVRVMWRLRRLHLDAAVNLEIFGRASAALTYVSGARIRVGFHRFHGEGLYCGDLLTHRVSYNPYQHTGTAFLTLVEALAKPADEVPLLKLSLTSPSQLPPLVPADHERADILKKLAKLGYPVDQRPPIVIFNINASDLLPLRRWPIERFKELALRCLQTYNDLWIVLTGSLEEAEPVEQFQRQLNHSRVVSLAGQTTLRGLVVLFTLSDVLITNDSGPAHFAALTPINIISLFGPETPLLYQPLSEHNRSLTAQLACSPCINVFNQRRSACNDNKCMQALSTDMVFDAFEEAMRQRTKTSE